MTLKPPGGANTPIVDAGVLDVHDFGARGDGVTDDSTAILAAYAALPTLTNRKTGKLLFQPGATYNISQTLILDAAGGVVLEGVGGTPGYPRLVWTGAAGTGPMIRINSGYGVQIRNMLLGYSSAAFNGDLVSTDWGGSSTDVSGFVMDGCWVGGLSGAVGAASLVKLNKTIASVIRGCNFQNAQVAIKRGTGYVTTLSIKDNIFANLTAVCIRDPDNRWSIRDNVFEPLASGAPGAIDQTLVGGFLGAWVTGLDLTANYFADASIAGTWVKLRSAGGLVSGNYVVVPTGGTGFYLERCLGLSFVANDIEGGLYGIDFANASGNLHEDVTIFGGANTSGTPIRNPGNCFGLEVRGVYPHATNPPYGVDIGYQTVASATSLTLPTAIPGGLVAVSGTTTITSITASFAGRLVTLHLTSTAQVTDGGNLKLSANSTGAADRTLTLRCDGTNWLEVARSAN